MIGTNMGYQPGPKSNVQKLYAVWPTKTDSQKWLWLKHYRRVFYKDEKTFELKELVLTEEEYTMWLLANNIPNSSSGKISKQ